MMLHPLVDWAFSFLFLTAATCMSAADLADSLRPLGDLFLRYLKSQMLEMDRTSPIGPEDLDALHRFNADGFQPAILRRYR
jgi:hypothetical protein